MGLAGRWVGGGERGDLIKGNAGSAWSTIIRALVAGNEVN